MSGKQFNEHQRKAIELRDTGIVVSAAAGSGKTSVLTERILRLIEQGEDIEVRGQPERIGHRGRYQPADQIAGDVAGDIGRERAARIGRAALLAELG